jgi:formamidopyrimidine-DNA glycosylase
MPELVEVETIREIVEPQIAGHVIGKVTVNNPAVIACPSAEAFCTLLRGQRITGITRRGKYLIFGLESGDRMIMHLRMTGSLLVTPQNYPLEKHTHVIFDLSGDIQLRFIDPRRFGRFWLIRSGQEDTESGIAKLGIEPFDPGLTAEYLKSAFAKRKKSVKACLLDQEIIAGIGNIYACEILFASGIRPDRSACSLSEKELAVLAEKIPEVLKYFISRNKTTPEQYLAGKGWDYQNTPWFRVYGHEGKPCPVCGATLVHEKIGGRGTTWCPHCQN